MQVALTVAPYGLHERRHGAASLDMACIIALLRQECGIEGVRYVDHSGSPLYLYARALNGAAADGRLLPMDLLPYERRNLLHRLVVEEILGVPGSYQTNNLFRVDTTLIRQLARLLTLAVDCMVQAIVSPHCDVVIQFIWADISFSLILAHRLRCADSNVQIVCCDYYTMEPGSPYVAAPLTRLDVHGHSIESMLLCDPLVSVLEQLVPETIDWLIMGEGFDVIRTLFGSKLGAPPLSGMNYRSARQVQPATVGTIPARRLGGITIIQSQPVDIDSLPLPDYTLLRPVIDSGQIEMSRGCGYRCVFCERKGLLGSGVRVHSPEYMEMLVAHVLSYDFKFYAFTDASLNVNEEATLQALERLTLKGLKFPYLASLRCRPANHQLLKVMRDTGCQVISMGIESGSQEVLNSMGKGQRLEVVEALVAATARWSQKLMLFFISGFPTDTPQFAEQTLALLGRLSRVGDIMIAELEPYHPGHTQALCPVHYQEYGVTWAPVESLEAVRQSSALFCEPGIFGLATYSRGMNRSELHASLLHFASETAARGIHSMIPIGESPAALRQDGSPVSP